MHDFATTLAIGRAGESAIAQWLRRRQQCVLPVYEKIIDEGKGPQVFLPEGHSLVAPDLLTFGKKGTAWVEAKHKNAFSWDRTSQMWVTGIDLRHYLDYLKVARLSQWPVWLLFLHLGGQAKDSPETSPSGLFGEEIKALSRCEHHRSDKWARGMVYWGIGALRFLASLDQLYFTSQNGHGSRPANGLAPRGGSDEAARVFSGDER